MHIRILAWNICKRVTGPLITLTETRRYNVIVLSVPVFPMTKRRPQKSRRAMTREMLLPIAPSVARRRSIEHHMACHQLASGNGSPAGFAQLFEAISCAYFVHFATKGRAGLDIFREAERELSECYARAKAEGRFDGVSRDMAAVRKVLLLRDEQLQTVPSHILDVAQERFLRYVRRDGDDSPIVPEHDCVNSPSL